MWIHRRNKSDLISYTWDVQAVLQLNIAVAHATGDREDKVGQSKWTTR